MLRPIATQCLVAAIALTGPLTASAAMADDVRFQFASVYDYSSGTYGDKKTTDVQTLSFSGRASYDGFRLRIYVPLLNIHGPAGNVVIEGGNPGHGSSVSHGLGDTTTTLTYTIDEPSLKPFYAVVGGSLRAPTGNFAAGLGVGAFDYGLQDELGADLGKGGLYLSSGYRFRGNHSVHSHRLDGSLLSSGFWVNVGNDWQAGAYYSWTERITRSLTDQQDLGAYVRYDVAKDLTLQLYGGFGLTRASEDIDAGLRLAWTL